MKKLVLLLTVILFTAISVNVLAQSSGLEPAPGATHSYYITPGNATNSISWIITKGTLTDTTDAGTITVLQADSISISWADTVTVGDWYYVHVTETDLSGCSNNKILPVEITASPFYLTLLASNDDQCYDGAVSASIDLSDPSIINYDHGTATLEFSVTPNGLSSSYSGYSFDIDIDFGAYLFASDLDASNISITSGNASISGSTVTVSDNNAVTISYVVDNNHLFDNGSAIDAQDYIATVTISNGEASNGVNENGTDGTYVDDTSVSRPNTSGIGTN